MHRLDLENEHPIISKAVDYAFKLPEVDVCIFVCVYSSILHLNSWFYFKSKIGDYTIVLYYNIAVWAFISLIGFP